MKKTNYVHITVVVLFLLLGYGCASFKGGNLPPITKWPPDTALKGKTICTVVSLKHTFNGEGQAVNMDANEKLKEKVISAYKDSLLFSEVKSGLSDTDLRAEINILLREEGSKALATISGLTLCVIPATATVDIIVKTTIQDKENHIIGSYEKSETLTTWFQVLLLFALPTNAPGLMEKETIYDLNRATIVDAHNDRIL